MDDNEYEDGDWIPDPDDLDEDDEEELRLAIQQQMTQLEMEILDLRDKFIETNDPLAQEAWIESARVINRIARL